MQNEMKNLIDLIKIVETTKEKIFNTVNILNNKTHL